MLQWQIRVIEEKRELDERLAKLTAFIQSPAFGNVTEPESTLLRVQAMLMADLSLVLSERIKSWDRPRAAVAAQAHAEEARA